MSFLSSSVSSSSLSTPTGSTSPLRFHSVYPSFLPLHGIHSLYAAILETPVILHAIEEIPLFREDSISHELVRLFHGITQAQRHLHSLERPLEDSHIPLHMNLAELPRHVISALHLHGFGTFISMLSPKIIYPTFRRIFFSFTQAEQDSYLEQLEHASMPLPRLSPLTHPIPPPLTSRLSTPPLSMTPSSPTAVNSTDSDDDLTDPDNGAFPVPRDTAQHIRLPDGSRILSSPTRVLPRPDTLRPAPAGPLTECFRCHLLSHYREDCPSYTCPHCHLSTPGHPSSTCLRFQCDFCRNWGHRDQFCPHRVCRICDTPGHVTDDCPIEHLSPSQSSVIFGGP